MYAIIKSKNKFLFGDMMLKSFLTSINKYNMLSYGDYIIAGFSGGADSVLLLTLLMELREEYALNIAAVHVHHGIRGDEADADEAFARAYCKQIGAELLVFHEDVPKTAKKMKLSLEEAGREIRYKLFEQAMRSGNANKIAVAHNRNDNAETVFMRICRGTGLSGLCGIPPVRGPIIRPLIETGRAEIENYLSDHGIPYRTDSTNFSNNITRNYFRNMLIPEIEAALNIDLCEKLNSLSRFCALDDDFIDKASREALKESLIPSGSKALSIPALRAYHPAITARIIRLILSELGLKDISSYHILAAQSLIETQSGKLRQLPGDIRVMRFHNELRFSSIKKESPRHFLYDLKPDAPLYVPELSRYFLLTEKQAPKKSHIVCTKTFLYDRIADVQIRSRKPGDRIRIKHIGTVKLKEYFINNKIPIYQRDVCGLAAQGSDVLWIIDQKNICHEQFVAIDSESRRIFIHTWEEEC